MALFSNLKKRIKTLKPDKSSLPSFGTRHTLERDWKILIISFAILFILVVVANLYFYTRVSARDIFSVNSNTAREASVLDRKELDHSLEVIEEKRVKYEEASRNPVIIPDPF